MLLFENDWYVFENAVSQFPQVVLALGDAFKFDVGVDVTQAVRGLKLLGASLLDQITEHKLNLKAVLCVS